MLIALNLIPLNLFAINLFAINLFAINLLVLNLFALRHFRGDNLLPELLPFKPTAKNQPPNLAVEIRTQDGDVVLGQTAQQLAIKIVGACGGCAAVALLKRATALVDVFFQAVV